MQLRLVPLDGHMTRTCTKCKESKPVADFNRYGGKKKGLRPDCKSCQSKRFDAYVQRNRAALTYRKRQRRLANLDAVRAKGREWDAANKDKIKAKNARRDYRWLAIQQKYGITREQWEALLVSQGGRCAVCQTDNPVPRTWSVDHDHITGKVRGLLCRRCNTGLGCFRDDIDRMVSAIDYLRRHR
jgi:Recombination endonuclease VII